MASFSVLTAFWIIKIGQVKERSKVKKTEDSSCSLPLHFLSTSPSPFSTCYIPFQRSGIQESNSSNRVQFGAKMRKIWPSEDNCSRLVRNFRTTPWLCEPCAKLTQHLGCANLVWNSHNTRTTPSKFAQPMRGANFPLFLHARTTDFLDIFSLIFSHVNSFCNLVFSRHKALSCHFSIYRGAQCLQKIGDDRGDQSSIH